MKTTTIPLSPKGFRLGELLVVPDDPARELSADQLIRDVEAAGYRRVSEIDDWQLFRPRSSWRDGIRRHAQLRTRDLVLRVERDAAGARVRVAGLLTSPLERHLATLGALYAPATP